ncbi:MAG: hypothetical protein ACTSYI_18080 [Promethearchaeota archaeon]
MQRGKTAEGFSYVQDNETNYVVDEFCRLEKILSAINIPVQRIQSITGKKKYEFGWQP